MCKTYDIRKLGGDKIALLGLFALSLLTARLVVGVRSTLVLSGPIPLRGTGLSVSVPAGNGWQSQGVWQSNGRSFILRSGFSAGPGEGTAGVVCRYYPALESTTTQLRFERKARELDGGIVEMDQKVTDSLVFDWARIEVDKDLSTAFLATTVLQDGNLLDIEVYEITGDAEQAEQVFHQVIESVRFDDGRLRTAAQAQPESKRNHHEHRTARKDNSSATDNPHGNPRGDRDVFLHRGNGMHAGALCQRSS